MLKNRTSEDGRCLNKVETSVLVLSELNIGKLKLDMSDIKFIEFTLSETFFLKNVIRI